MRKGKLVKKIAMSVFLFCMSNQTVLAQTTASVSMAEEKASCVVLNEICAKNTTFSASDGGYYDWIELYNSSESSIDLSGYGLSDNENKPYKFTFPDGTIIESGQYLLVFCDADATKLNGQLATSFGLSTDGETVILTDSAGNRVDTVVFGQMVADTSYGRVPDGTETFAYLETTPEQSNTLSGSVKVDIAAPEFSKACGFYDDAFQLEIEAKEGYTIRYTTDGSDPTIDSEIYAEPLNIEDISSSENV